MNFFWLVLILSTMAAALPSSAKRLGHVQPKVPKMSVAAT
jgi:hypothetical protein